MIWQFKKASAPSMVTDGWFMKVPHLNSVQRGSSDNHWLNKMKSCALESIAVGSTGAGSWSTLEDGAPTAVQMSDSRELKMVISEDSDSFENILNRRTLMASCLYLLANIELAVRPIQFPWSEQQYKVAKNIFRRFKINDSALDTLCISGN